MEDTKLEYVKIADLKTDEKNPNQMTEAQMNSLKASMDTYGNLQPIVVDQLNNVVDGAHRLLVYKMAGKETIPAIRVSLQSDTDRRIIRQTMNKLRGKHDPALDAEEFVEILKAGQEKKFFDITAIRQAEFYKLMQLLSQEKDVDFIPQIKDTPTSKIGDMWVLGRHRLICGDSTKPETYTALMQGEKASMYITDPPYGVSYADKNTYLNAIAPGNRIQTPIENDHKTRQEMGELWNSAFNLASKNMADGAPYYIHAMQGGDLMMMMMNSILSAGLLLKHMLIWVKNNHVLGRLDYHYQHEPIFYGWKEGSHKFYGYGQTSVWRCDKPTSSKLHPTMKPVELAERAILNSSLEGETILDNFAGAGFSLIASEKLRRKWRGVELDPKYCETIVARWELYTGQKAEKIQSKEGA